MSEALRQLVSALYARPPISLAEFAPLAFAAHEDPVARPILIAASAALGDLLSAVRAPDLSGPVVVGGSIIVRGMLAAPPSLQAELVPLVRDRDSGFRRPGGRGSAGFAARRPRR